MEISSASRNLLGSMDRGLRLIFGSFEDGLVQRKNGFMKPLLSTLIPSTEPLSDLADTVRNRVFFVPFDTDLEGQGEPPISASRN